MATDAQYANGESILPQARPTTTIEWAYANGESGNIPIGPYVSPDGPPPASRFYLHNQMVIRGGKARMY